MILGAKVQSRGQSGEMRTLLDEQRSETFLIPMAPSTIVGAGFFYFGPRLAKLRLVFVINEAHDGYLEVYLNWTYSAW